MLSISGMRLKFRIDKLINLICGFDNVFSPYPYHVHQRKGFFLFCVALRISAATVTAAYMREYKNSISISMFTLPAHFIARAFQTSISFVIARQLKWISIFWLVDTEWVIDYCSHFKEPLIMEFKPLSPIMLLLLFFYVL